MLIGTVLGSMSWQRARLRRPTVARVRTAKEGMTGVLMLLVLVVLYGHLSVLVRLERLCLALDSPRRVVSGRKTCTDLRVVYAGTPEICLKETKNERTCKGQRTWLKDMY